MEAGLMSMPRGRQSLKTFYFFDALREHSARMCVCVCSCVRAFARVRVRLMTASNSRACRFSWDSVYDVAIYTSNKDGTCQCGADACLAYPNTCCVDGLNSTYEGFGNVVTKNGMERFHGLVGGGGESPATDAVDSYFDGTRLALSSGNSAGVLFESLLDASNLDFRPRANSTWANSGIGAYDHAIAGSGEYWIPGRQVCRFIVDESFEKIADIR